MKQQTLDLLKEVTEVNGVPGYEAQVAAVVEAHLKDLCEIERDNLGSIICKTTGTAPGPKVMLAGHMDEIGFMVKHITEQGFIKFHNLGGWLPQVVLAQKVVIETSRGPLTGVVGAKPPHISSNKDKATTLDSLFIDVGAKNIKQATKQFGIRLGDPIVAATPFTQLNNKKLLMAKAWDDRVGVALMVEAMKAMAGKKHPNTLYGVGTVQEEVGLRGAQTAVQSVAPEVGLILETAIAGDVPGVNGEGHPSLGKGAAIYFFEGSAIPNTKLRDLALDICAKKKIKHQLAFLARGGTDAGRMHVHARGVPCLVLGVPTRYIHTPAGIIHASDYEATLTLLIELIKALDQETVASLTTPR